MGPLFDVVDPSGDAPPDLFGLWEPAAAGVVAFGGRTPESSLWRARLPADPLRAAAQLQEGQQQLARSDLALRHVELRIARAGREETMIAFGGDEPSPAALLALVERLGGTEVDASFGVGQSLAGRWATLEEEVQSFFRQVRDAVAHLLRVESVQGGVALGTTAVGWSGNMRAFWPLQRTAEQVALHQGAVRLAIASRHLLVRTAMLLLGSAPRLFALVGGGGAVGVVAALPAAWKLVNDVLREYRTFQLSKERVNG